MKQVDVVGAVIINDRDEILCALRSMKMSLPGYWEFPGGKIEPGEDHQAALVREIKEELLCEIEVGEFITDIVHEYPTIKVRLITYEAKIISGSPVATEHEKLEWTARKDIRNLHWAPADIPTIDILCCESNGWERSILL
ncbi:(deoxy)nucleoside triphosphate pyrophosphohydrolase [Paenibacillus agilis]|uniref:8-oxo-dGTP diphosphatase n=1 Tax=Paenibacillus agilis TaxID=3020863 RepID=A0A559IGU1_9BACL|nr:(deoxy)nucleoside triphosphate pyrophosphohydrolase [Paenibacillus agilis]TVX86861.1 (deoxy)nucleoside triphosphate pyrophosphohydrolase [Paenibacillus agilis]